MLTKIKDILLKNILLAIICGLILIEGAAITYIILKPKETTEHKSITDPIISDNIEETSVATTIKVDIKGQVTNPGVYELPANSIVQDLITISGGLKKNATTENLNLSKQLKDETVIIVYTAAELKKLTTVSSISCDDANINNCETNGTKSSVIEAGVNAGSSIVKPSIVNINTASLAELMTLSGIGEAKAESIIAYRNEHGNFKSIEEVKEISGIGESIFAKIKDSITI